MANLPKSRGGFTLIEVIISLSLFALMTVILYGTFYLGHRAVEKGQAHFESSQSERSEVELLAGYIRSAYPYRSSVKDAAVFFDGEETRLSFVSALSSGMGGRGMAQILLAWNEGQDGDGRLTIEERIPVRLGSEDESSGYRNQVVLREGVRNMRMGYLESNDTDPVWVERWDGNDQKALPRAVRVELVSANGKESRWIFPIMMSVLAP